jgi:imidazolonepropionase-like amidohydrolase
VEGKRLKESPQDIQSEINTASQQLKTYSDAGGQILFGTDVGYTEYFDTSEEFKLMAQAGLNWRQILASLTSSPASRFKNGKQSGMISTGAEADLVVLNGDPADDVMAFSKVRYTIRDGSVVYDQGKNGQ